ICARRSRSTDSFRLARNHASARASPAGKAIEVSRPAAITAVALSRTLLARPLTGRLRHIGTPPDEQDYIFLSGNEQDVAPRIAKIGVRHDARRRFECTPFRAHMNVHDACAVSARLPPDPRALR